MSNEKIVAAIRINRHKFTPKATLGKVLIRFLNEDTYEPFGHIIEDVDRHLTSDMTVEDITRIKIAGETAIPTGIYKLKKTWSPKYNKMMWEVTGVKGFHGIRLHSGNTPEDTKGCLCMALRCNVEKMTTSDSVKANVWIDQKLDESFMHGLQVTIEIMGQYQ